MRICLLGTPRLHLSGGAVHPLADSDALLLAMLVMEHGVSRRRASQLIWPDSDARRAGQSLRQRLFRLKRAAGRDVVVGDPMLSLTEGIGTDLGQLEAGLLHDPEHGRGELLAGVRPPSDSETGQWLAQVRERWSQQLHAALADRAEACIAGQQLAAALRYAERLVNEAPWAEHAHRRVMRLHYLRGDHAAALAAHRRCVEWLARELDAQPCAETRQLAAHIERQAPPSGATPPAAPPLTLLRPPAWVGRDDARRRIEAAWQAGRGVLLCGEPGMGKSRLLAEMAARARGGAVLIESRPGDAGVPCGVAARLVQAWLAACGKPAQEDTVREWARFLPELGTAPDRVATTARLHESLAGWAAHAGAAHVDTLLVDDLQFADAASLDALLELAASHPPLRWMLAVRSGERPDALQSWLASPHADRVEEIHLEPLAAAAVADLLSSLDLPGLKVAPWADALWRHAGGNPFYTLQTLLACGPQAREEPPPTLPVPVHLGQLVQRRLQQLQPAALRLAQLAALAEADFSAALAARVLQRHVLDLAPAWAELEAAQVLRQSAFAHDLVREAVAATVPVPIARELHRQVADALDGSAVPPARLARHREQAGQAAQAAAAYVAAADQALAAGLRREEAAALDAALRGLVQPTDRARRFALLARRCRVGRYVDAYADQLARTAALKALAEGPCEAADAALCEAAVLAEGQQWAKALQAVEAALACTAADDAFRRRRAAALLGRCRMGLGDAEAAIRAMQASVDDALQAGDAEAGRYLIDLSVLLGKADRPREAWPLLQRTRAAAEAAQDWGLASEACVYLGWLHTTWARTRRSIPYYEKARELHALAGASMSMPVGPFIGLARQYRELGRYAEAQQLLDAVFNAQGGAGRYPMRTVALMDLTVLYLELGQPARALQMLGSGRSPPADAYAPSWLVSRARIETWAGRAAVDLLQAAYDHVRGDGQRLLRWVVARDLALALAPDEGEALARAHADECAAVDCPHALWGLRLARCDRLQALGRIDEAAAIARTALARFAGGVPPGIYPPRAWLIVRRALQAAQDARAAAAAHAQGRRWVHQWAVPHVPAPYLDSFLNRNPFNPAFSAEFLAERG